MLEQPLTSYRAGVEGRKDLQGGGPKWIGGPLHIELPACRVSRWNFGPKISWLEVQTDYPVPVC